MVRKPIRVRARSFSLNTTDREDLAAQGDFAGHGHVASAQEIFVIALTMDVQMVIPRRTVLGMAPRNVHVIRGCDRNPWQTEGRGTRAGYNSCAACADSCMTSPVCGWGQAAFTSIMAAFGN